MTTGERLVRGVLEHWSLSLTYPGFRRTVAPYLVGIHEAGEPVLVGYRTAGGYQLSAISGRRERTAGS